MRDSIFDEGSERMWLVRALALAASFLVSASLALALYLRFSIVLLAVVILGLTALAGVATLIPYRGWLYFGVPVLGAVAVSLMGAAFFS
jgi:hypothetical protein